MNLDSTTSGSVWTIVYAIPGFSSQKDCFFAIKYFLILAVVKEWVVKKQGVILYSFSLSELQWDEPDKSLSLSPHCPVSQHMGCGMGAEEEKMMVGNSKLPQAPPGLLLSSLSFCGKVLLLLVII